MTLCSRVVSLACVYACTPACLLSVHIHMVSESQHRGDVYSGVIGGVLCRTEPSSAAACANVSQSRLWSHLDVHVREPYVLTHGVKSYVPGSNVVVVGFKAFVLESLKATARQYLDLQLSEWRERPGFSQQKLKVVSCAVGQIFDYLIDGVVEGARVAGSQKVMTPLCQIWDGAGTRVHVSVPIGPIIVLSVEEDPKEGKKPLVVSAHAMLPLKPGAVCSAPELLSLSLDPGEHRLFLHLPRADTLDSDETLTSNAIVFSRTSAMADIVRSYETTLNSEILRHGAHMRNLKAHVAAQGGRWVVRHVRMAANAAVAPPAQHPCGSLDVLPRG